LASKFTRLKKGRRRRRKKRERVGGLKKKKGSRRANRGILAEIELRELNGSGLLDWTDAWNKKGRGYRKEKRTDLKIRGVIV